MSRVLSDAPLGAARQQLDWLCQHVKPPPAQAERFTQSLAALVRALDELERAADARSDPAIPAADGEQRLAYQAYLLDHIYNAVIASDERFNVTFWNRVAERMYGWRAAEALGRNMYDLVRFEMPAALLDEVRRKLATDGAAQAEALHFGKDGQPVHVELNVISLRDARGAVSGYVTLNRGIGECKRAEEQQQRNAFLLDQLNDAVVAVDEQLVITTWNRAAERLYGWRADEIIGHRLREFVRSEFSDEQRAEHEAQLHARCAEALARNTAQFNTTLGLDAVIQTACAETARTLAVPIVSIALYDDKQATLNYADSIGLPLSYTSRAAPSATSAEQILARYGKPLVIPDLQHVPTD